MLANFQHDPGRYHIDTPDYPASNEQTAFHMNGGAGEESKQANESHHRLQFRDSIGTMLQSQHNISYHSVTVNHSSDLPIMTAMTRSLSVSTHQNSAQPWYKLLFHHLIQRLMTSHERYIYYAAMACTVSLSVLRLSFFIVLTAIIDLVASHNSNHNNYIYAFIHHICMQYGRIDQCKSNASLSHVLMIILLVAFVCSALIGFAQRLLSTHVLCQFMQRLNVAVFDDIIARNLSFFDGQENRDLRALLSDDLKHIRITLEKLQVLIQELLLFVCGVLYVFIVNWSIALIIVGSFVFALMFSVLYSHQQVTIAKHRNHAFRLLVAEIQQMLHSLMTIKTFSKEHDESFVYEKYVARAYKYHGRQNGYLYAYLLSMKLIWYLTTLTILWYDTHLILSDDDGDSTMSVGILVVDVCIFMQLNWNIYQLVTLRPVVLDKGCESVSRIIAVFDSQRVDTPGKSDESIAIVDDGQYIPPHEDIRGLITIKNVCFSYDYKKSSPADEEDEDHEFINTSSLRQDWILHDVSLTFTPSTTTALVGVSGSGKSTIIKLLMRFYEHQTGDILVDDTKIQRYSLPFLHSKIGYVGQQVHLFTNRSIGDNIKYAMKADSKFARDCDAEFFDEERMYFWRQSKSITQSDVEKAAKIANAHGFIKTFKHGYNTIIGGKHGVTLSAGERQRIAIARTILLNPKVLLLDEAMSNVDPISKHLITESLESIMVGRTVVVIAHRLKTVMNADAIYVVHKGRIIQSGTHHQLVGDTEGVYAQFVENQKFA